MIQPNKCPACPSDETELVATSYETDVIEEVYICHNCPTEYTVTYEAFEKEVTNVDP